MSFLITENYYDKTINLTDNYIDIRLCELGHDSIIYYRINGTQSTLNTRKSLFKKIISNYCPKQRNHCIIDNPIFNLIITYPLSKTIEVPINLVNLTWIELFRIITNIYTEIHSNQDKYGVYFWGHTINDLELGRLIFRKDPIHNKNIILLYIDS